MWEVFGGPFYRHIVEQGVTCVWGTNKEGGEFMAIHRYIIHWLMGQRGAVELGNLGPPAFHFVMTAPGWQPANTTTTRHGPSSQRQLIQWDDKRPNGSTLFMRFCLWVCLCADTCRREDLLSFDYYGGITTLGCIIDEDTLWTSLRFKVIYSDPADWGETRCSRITVRQHLSDSFPLNLFGHGGC